MSGTSPTERCSQSSSGSSSSTLTGAEWGVLRSLVFVFQCLKPWECLRFVSDRGWGWSDFDAIMLHLRVGWLAKTNCLPAHYHHHHHHHHHHPASSSSSSSAASPSPPPPPPSSSSSPSPSHLNFLRSPRQHKDCCFLFTGFQGCVGCLLFAIETLDLGDLRGWVLHVNECLRDASGDSNKETNQSGQSGQSGDEEMKAVAFEDSVVESAPSFAMEIAEPAVHHSRPSREAPAGLYLDPCLFYSYTAGCAKGEECEYSHSIHADQVAVPEAKQRRGQARLRIKKRLNQHFAAQSLYEVHQELQQEAHKDSYAKQLIRRHLTRDRFIHICQIGHIGRIGRIGRIGIDIINAPYWRLSQVST